MISNIFQRLHLSLKRQGFRETAVKFLTYTADRLYDLRHGIDTCQPAPLQGLTVAGPNRASGTEYQPSRVLLLRRLFRALEPVMPENKVLVDYGCGKGRVLLVASEFGFHKLRGVEFASELCRIASSNCTRFASARRADLDWEIIEMDAAQYQVRRDETVFFMFNPFEETVMRAVLENIGRSLREHPRRSLLIYYNPRMAAAIEARAEFKPLLNLNFWGYHFKVYST